MKPKVETQSHAARNTHTKARKSKTFKLAPISIEELDAMSKEACVPPSYMLDTIIHASYIRWLENKKIERQLKEG